MLQEPLGPTRSPDHEFQGTILVVDDDDFCLDMMQRRLIREGYAVNAANSGFVALQMMRSRPYDLVLLDIVMPDMDGRELLRIARESWSSTELPVIMVTAEDDSGNIAESFRIGANDYIVKPFEFNVLLARVKTQIARRRAELALLHNQDELERHVEQRTAELRKANRELEDARNILSDAIEAVPDGFVLWDSDDRLVTCNRWYREFFGANADAVVPGVRFAELMKLQADSGALRGALGNHGEWLSKRLARHADPLDPFEEEFADGSWARMSETRASGGRTVGLCTDITEIKRREIALKTFAETNRRFAAAINATTNAVLITDPRRPGNPTVFANPAFAEMTGWPVEEALGRNRTFLAGPDTDKEEIARLNASMRDGIPATAELILYRRDGNAFWAEISASPIRENNGETSFWVVIQTDITDRKNTERQLQQAQKMEIIGQLTGGLAHDFNNLLTIILGNLGLAMTVQGDADCPAREHLQSAIDAGQRGAALTKRMLAFARRQTLAPGIIDLGETAAGMETLLARTLGSSVNIMTELEPGPWPVLLDSSQIENAILNLAVNARDAMPDGGALTIAVENRVMGNPDETGIPELERGDYVCLSVSDTGIGMPPDVVEKATQPFFSTKEEGKGTGLGLSMVYGFVSQSSGYLRIDSTPGAGTRVELYFPRAAASNATPPVHQTAADRNARDAASGGLETVLLVDDDPDVRAIAAISLGRLGYEILQAEDAASALDILDGGAQIDLLLTDIGLPGAMDGTGLAQTVRDRAPTVRVLYVSGYSEGFSPERIEQDPGASFLAKPYDQATLARSVRETLDAEPGSNARLVSSSV